MNDQLNGIGRRPENLERAFEVVLERGIDQDVHGVNGVAGSGGIRGVCRQEKSRVLAAEQTPAEVGRDMQGELDFAEVQQPVELGFALDLVADVKVIAVLEGGDEAAVLSALKTAVGRCLGSELMAKPKRTSCIRGIPIIMPNVSRSRRIWMNSLATMAENRRRLNWRVFI
jgi:hypothetical protein